MRRLKRGGIALTVLLAAAVPALAGDQDGQPSSGSTGLWANLFGHKDKPSDKIITPPADDKASAGVVGDPAATVFEREQAALLRRMQVCGQLKQFAIQAGDNEQLHRIEQLEERIWPLYQQRTGNLPVSPAMAGVDNARLDQARSSLSHQSIAASGNGLPETARSANLGGDK